MSVKLKTGRSARVPGTQSVIWLHRNFKWNDIDPTTPSTGVPGGFFGVLPANALPLETYVRINTAFAGADLTVGTTGNLSALVSTSDLASGTTGVYVVDRFMGTYSTSDTLLYCACGSSGQTAGEADIWQAYLPVYPST